VVISYIDAEKPFQKPSKGTKHKAPVGNVNLLELSLLISDEELFLALFVLHA
jgi:hypothetical protein